MSPTEAVVVYIFLLSWSFRVPRSVNTFTRRLISSIKVLTRSMAEVSSTRSYHGFD